MYRNYGEQKIKAKSICCGCGGGMRFPKPPPPTKIDVLVLYPPTQSLTKSGGGGASLDEYHNSYYVDPPDDAKALASFIRIVQGHVNTVFRDSGIDLEFNFIPQQLVVDGPCDDATKPSCGLKSRVDKYKDGFTKRAYCVASGYKYADGTPVPDCVTGGAWNAPKCDCAKKVPKPSWSNDFDSDRDWDRSLYMSLVNAKSEAACNEKDHLDKCRSVSGWYTPYLEHVEVLRVAAKADLVVYWRHNGGNGGGSNFPVKGEVVHPYVYVDYYAFNAHTLAHELGHTLGAEHTQGIAKVAANMVEDNLRHCEYDAITGKEKSDTCCPTSGKHSCSRGAYGKTMYKTVMTEFTAPALPSDVEAVAFINRFSDAGRKPVPAADLSLADPSSSGFTAVPVPHDHKGVVKCSVSLDHLNKQSRCLFGEEIKLDGQDAVTTIRAHVAAAAAVSDAKNDGGVLRSNCDKRPSVFCPSS